MRFLLPVLLLPACLLLPERFPDTSLSVQNSAADAGVSADAAVIGGPDADVTADAAVLDASFEDAGVSDAGEVRDSGMVSDAGVSDAGLEDAGEQLDASVLDAGYDDAGEVDAGFVDAGTGTDGGSMTGASCTKDSDCPGSNAYCEAISGESGSCTTRCSTSADCSAGVQCCLASILGIAACCDIYGLASSGLATCM